VIESLPFVVGGVPLAKGTRPHSDCSNAFGGGEGKGHVPRNDVAVLGIGPTPRKACAPINCIYYVGNSSSRNIFGTAILL